MLTSVASDDEGLVLVRTLVERRLVACGTLLPASRSIYRWEGAIIDAAEVVVLLKTHAAHVPALKAAFGELHPYSVPELLVVPVQDGLDRYLAWIGEETRAPTA